MLIKLRILLTALLLALAVKPATAAILMIEGDLEGKPLRILVDAATARAEVTLDAKRHRIDLETEMARSVRQDGTLGDQETVNHTRSRPAPDIRPWGPGPMIAGHASVYHVIMLDEQICGELLISPWMKPFVSSAVEALTILERIKGHHDIKSATIKGPCRDLPFSSYASAGWPLMAGGVNQRLFTTEAISFDYQPGPDELSWTR